MQGAPREGRSKYEKDTHYHVMSGTSFSTPMVAATASLLLAKNSSLEPTQIEDIFMGTANDMDRPGWDWLTGAGLFNATQALKQDSRVFTIVKITDFQLTRDKDKKNKLKYVDIFGSVRGDINEFVVKVGKGVRAQKFEKVAGPFQNEAQYDWIARIDEKFLKGSEEWIVRIEATDKDGQPYVADGLLLIGTN